MARTKLKDRGKIKIQKQFYPELETFQSFTPEQWDSWRRKIEEMTRREGRRLVKFRGLI